MASGRLVDPAKHFTDCRALGLRGSITPQICLDRTRVDGEMVKGVAKMFYPHLLGLS